MTKESLRAELLAKRRSRGSASTHQDAQALAAHALSLKSVTGANRVAAYLSMPGEPPTDELISGLVARGTEVIVPVVREDGYLDWVAWHPNAVMRISAVGSSEPDGPRLGPHALHDCAQIFVPALAIDHEGNRLGRGGGFYDRALANAGAPKAALLFDTEILSSIPHEPHDITVDAAVCPGGVFRILR